MYIITFGPCREEYRKKSSVEKRIKELTGYPVKINPAPGQQVGVLGVVISHTDER